MTPKISIFWPLTEWSICGPFVVPRPEDLVSFFLLLNHDSFAYEDRLVVSEKRKIKLYVIERDQIVRVIP